MGDALPEPHVLASAVAAELSALLKRYGMDVIYVDKDAAIPGSFWGDSEAGLISNTLYLRIDTPLHSALHEASHYICMAPDRRATLDTNAGGDTLEECAVCYLQILLADCFANLNSAQLMRDMDAWGYSFRLGSSTPWFHEDADDARAWLIKYGILNQENQLSYCLRGKP